MKLEDANAALSTCVLHLGAAASVSGVAGIGDIKKGLRDADAKLERFSVEVRWEAAVEGALYLRPLA
jgi:hypothetical protein